jgi:hypothetical protein
VALLKPGPDRLEHLLLVGELAGLELGVDQLAVDGQLETTAARWDQFEVADLLLELTQQLARQTDGLRLVVSHRAVFQLHVHRGLLAKGGPCPRDRGRDGPATLP